MIPTERFFRSMEDPRRLQLAQVNPYIWEVARNSTLPILSPNVMIESQGRWKSALARHMGQDPRALVLEIGCHFGKTLYDMAYHNQDIAFVGLDITYKRVVKTARRIQELSNAQVAHMDARALGRIFDRKELDGCVLFYPDPWTKLKKRKHRLLTTEFVDKLTQCVGEWIWIRTDVEAYFEETQQILSQKGWQQCSLRTQGIYTSSFEILFSQDSQKSVYEGVFLPENGVLKETFHNFFKLDQERTTYCVASSHV